MNRRLSLGPRAELWAGWCGVGGFSLSFMDANSRRLAVRPASSSGETGWPAASDASTISLRMAAGDSRCRETHGRAAAGRPGEAAEAGELRALLGVWTSYQCEGPMVCNWGDSLSLPFFSDGTAGPARHLCSQCTPAFLSSRKTVSKPSVGVIAIEVTPGTRPTTRKAPAVALLAKTVPPPTLSCPTSAVATIGAIPGAGGPQQVATRPMASCSALTARIVSLVPTWPGPTFIAAADG